MLLIALQVSAFRHMQIYMLTKWTRQVLQFGIKHIYIYSFKGAIQLQKIREWHCHQTSNAEIARTVCGCGCGWLVDGEPVNILCIVSIAFHQIEALRFPRAAIHGIEHELCARELKILRWFLGNLCVWCDLRERQKCVQYMWWLLRIVYHVN